MEPFIVCLWILAGVCAITWVLSLITGEHSWVDRIWSVVPVAYVWVFAGAAGLQDDYLDQFVGGLSDAQRQQAMAAAQRWPAN